MFSRMPLKERIAQAVFRLETQLNRLEQAANRLHQRDREMFERCIGAKAQGDMAHAIIYANECAEIRKMHKIVLSSQLALERVVLRLKTIEEVGDILIHLGPVLSIMKETKGKLTGIIPEVSRELEEIGEFLNGTLNEVGLAPDVKTNVEASSQEAKKILEEASTIAEEKLKELYPDLPIPPSEPETGSLEAESLAETGGEAELEQPEAEPAKPIEQVQIKPLKAEPPLEEVKEKLYEYLKAHRGELALTECCRELNVSKETVNKALELLAQEGKIRLQQA